jgi:hypothetical protein
MFKSLFTRFKVRSQKEQTEKIVLDFLVTQLTIPPLNQRHFIAAGNGRATSVTTVPKGLLISFERKIAANDVVDGKLLPVVVQEVKRRGGKRYAAVTVSLEGAEELHELLGHVLAQRRRQTLFQDIIDRVWQMSYPPFWAQSRS